VKKPGLDFEEPQNYRPISNLTFISKVIERIVANQIKAYLADNDLMPFVQSAYRQGHSTKAAVLKVISDIIDAADTLCGKTLWVTLLGLLDMSAAFDTVDHKILHERLEVSFGVKGQALAWLRFFMTDRTQVVAFGGNKSFFAKVVVWCSAGICFRSSAVCPLLRECH